MSRSVLLTEVTPAPSKYVKLPPIARDEQKSIIHLPQIWAKAEEDHPVRAGFWDGSTKSPGDMHKQQLLQSSDRQALQVHRSQNTVRRCHRLPHDSSGYPPLDLVQASAETKLLPQRLRLPETGLTEMDKDIPEVKDMTEERPKIQKFMPTWKLASLVFMSSVD
ncbi:hypothetical protein DPEC_G00362100 [Dallia pectoralis]|nr:hypothetical protein DPEC_G00362100 [Dallia pectoralis]